MTAKRRHRRRCRGRRRGERRSRQVVGRARQRGRVVLEPRQRAAAREHATAARRSCSASSPAATTTSTTSSRRCRPSSLAATTATVTVAVGGRAEVFRQVERARSSPTSAAPRASRSRSRCILLVLVFGSLVAAGLPLLVGVRRDRRHRSSCCYVVASITDVSIFSLNLTTAHGPRARDRLQPVHRLALPRGAARTGSRRTTRSCARSQTAGRTVAVSALDGRGRRSPRCWLFPLAFLPSFAYAGIARRAARRARRGRRAARAARGARHRRSNSVRIFRHREPKPVGEGVWHRIATIGDAPPDPDRHRRHPAAARARRCRSSGSRSGSPTTASCRRTCRAAQVQDQIRAHFTSQEAGALAGGRARPRRPAGPRPSEIVRLRRRALEAPRRRARRRRSPGSYVDGQSIAGPGDGRPHASRATTAPGSASSRRSSRCPTPGEQLAHAGARPRRRRSARCSSNGPSAQLVDSKARCSVACRSRPRCGSRSADLRAAVPDVRERRRPDQGARAQRAQPHRDVRRDGVDLPGRPPVGAPRLHPDRHARRRRCRS